MPKHFHLLDAIRGMAALSVVFWHWVHFFLHDTSEFHREYQPLFGVFSSLYLKGWRAVDLFFCLSGFIFYWRYSHTVADRTISLRDFFVLRIARLYPLHVLTLVLVAVGQHLTLAKTGSYFVYPYNDLYHFVLQTFFIANFGLEKGWSFNAPVWSVSYEMALYTVFFGMCYLRFKRSWQLWLMVGAGCWLTFSNFPPLHQLAVCTISFFAGGLAFQAVAFLARRSLGVWVSIVLTCLTILIWIVAPGQTAHSTPSETLGGWGGNTIRQLAVLSLDLWFNYSFQLVVFPLTILTVALWETRRVFVPPGAGILGRISYSSYLLHFPLQMAFSMAVFGLGLPSTVFYTPVALGLFFAVLIPLSLACHHYFELPCQKAIRKRLVSSQHASRGHGG